MTSNAATYSAEVVVSTSITNPAADHLAKLHKETTGRLVASEPADEQLLFDVGEGSKEALGLLFRRHARAVFRVAYQVLRDECEADDLRQEVFIYLSERARLFDAKKGSGSSWIIQVTYHRAIDRRRYLESRRYYKTEEFDEQRFSIANVNETEASLDGSAILDRMRAELTTDQRQTLELHFFEGYSLREIAKEKGQTVGNVRHHYYRALERLRIICFPQSAARVREWLAHRAPRNRTR